MSSAQPSSFQVVSQQWSDSLLMKQNIGDEVVMMVKERTRMVTPTVERTTYTGFGQVRLPIWFRHVLGPVGSRECRKARKVRLDSQNSGWNTGGTLTS